MKTPLPITIACGGILAVLDGALAQTWTQTSAPTNSWVSVACSADGTKLIAAPGSKSPIPIYRSTNSGVTWQTNYISGVWAAVGSSADGGKLAAVGDGYICTSTNSGATWISNNVPGVRCIAASASGSKWVAAGGAHVYTSTNSGATWISNNIPNGSWYTVASSADGNRLVVAGVGSFYNGPIYTSTDMGVTWRLTPAPNLSWNSIASSADGLKLVALAAHTAFYAGVIYTSTNSGTNWTLTSAPSAAWSCVVSSADGTKLLAGALWDDTAQIRLPLYLSTNSGVTWTLASSPSRTWQAVASSADGRKLVGVVNAGGIYTTYSTPKPLLNIKPSGNNLILSWLVPSTNFVLRQNSDLTTTNWATLSSTPILNLTNLQNEVFLPPPASNSFYRLATP